MTATNPNVTVLFDNPSSEIRIVDRGTSTILAQQTGSDTASVRIAAAPVPTMSRSI